MRLYWLPDSNQPSALAYVLGDARGVYEDLSPRDTSAIRALANGEVVPKAAVVEWLREHQLLDELPAQSPTLDHDISRQIVAYSTFCSTAKATSIHQHIRSARVLLVGMGGAGCNVAQQLLGLGVQRFTLIDPDIVEYSNLNRQILYSANDIGLPKVSAAAKALASRGFSDVDVTPLKMNFLDWRPSSSTVQEFDLAIVSADSDPVALRRRASSIFYAAKVPHAFLGYSGTRANIGPIVFDFDHGCGNCFLHSIDFAGRMEVVFGSTHHNIAPSSASINGMLAAIVADIWPRYLAGAGHSSGIWKCDLSEPKLWHKELSRLSTCPVCADG